MSGICPKQMPKNWHLQTFIPPMNEWADVASELDDSVHARNRQMAHMIRVTKSEKGKRTIITIDGQLSDNCVEAVEICCNQAVLEGKPVDLYLQDVLIVDESGRALLTRLAAKGIRLLATGLYTSYVVRALVAGGSRVSGSPSAAAGASREKARPKSERGRR